MQNEDMICALCKWNRNISNKFSCSNLNQENMRLKHETNYNDSCDLFEEKEERKTMYDFLDKEKE